MWGIGAGRTAVRAVVVFLLTAITAPASAQTNYTWTGGAGTNDWLTSANWSPSGPPGVPGAPGSSDRALFDTAGTTVTATNLDNGYNLGAIVTIGASGGLLTTSFNGNQALRLTGGYTIGSFTNVVAAALNGRDLTIALTNMSFGFGSTGSPTTFYADAGRTVAIATQQINNSGGDVNKEGAGTLIWGGSVGLNRDLNNAEININGGTFAAHHSLNNVTRIDVAGGASLQAGLAIGDTLSTSALVVFANNANLRILTNGTTVTQLQNAAVLKEVTDTFRVTLAGLNPSGTETVTPNGIILQASSLSGFDPNGTYTPSSPGHFAVSGDGFVVTDWSLTVLNNNQVRLDSVTVTPVPETSEVFLAVAVGLTVLGLARRRATA